MVLILVDLRDRSFSRLKVLMKTSPRHRQHIALEVAQLIVRIPHKKIIIIAEMLKHLVIFLQMWCDIPVAVQVSSPGGPPGTEGVFLDEEAARRIEAMSLLCLCSPDGRVRYVHSLPG